MENLFAPLPPLAERVRPRTIDEVAGQEHLLGDGKPLRRFLENNELPSMILWGPPGTGKTTLANVLALSLNVPIHRLSAVESGVRDLREVIQRAEHTRATGQRTLLFIDEIHRFTKAQQDALLHAVEQGIITLVGATTENPSFEVNNALLSRCRVYRLEPLTPKNIRTIVERAIATDSELATKTIAIEDWDALIEAAGGDARNALNTLESAVGITPPNSNGVMSISREVLRNVLQQGVRNYDRAGDSHYDTVSAFIKSVRGSDPDAALLYLAIMIDAGEDPLFIARRLVILASEDVGNADPNALPLALAAFQALERIGMPEGRIPLAQAVTYLASAPKSNASYTAINKALDLVRATSRIPVPNHLRNAPTPLMKQQGYGLEYKYPHDAENHWIDENYFPVNIPPRAFYVPKNSGAEQQIAERLRNLWKGRYADNSLDE